jgi:hypothetical protein
VPGEVDRLLRMAADYASQALQNLVNQTAEDSEKLRELFYNHVDLACRLEVHFLFPNLGDADRLLLVGLSSSRRALEVGRRNSEHYRNPDQLKRHQEAMAGISHRFLGTRAEVVSRGLGRLMTSTQRQILEREFLAAPVMPKGPSAESAGEGR